MIDHQCQLAKKEESQEFLNAHKLKIDEVRVILKGRLFYPDALSFDAPPEVFQ